MYSRETPKTAATSPAVRQRPVSAQRDTASTDRLLFLQRTVGNAATGRILQRADWAPAAVPAGVGNESFGGGLTEGDIAALDEAAAAIAAAIAEAKAADKQVLLFLGVGTGNPTDGWGNPSVGVGGRVTEQSQHSPGFLDAAQQAEEPYFVIAANFNVGEAGVTTTATDTLLRLNVSAKFPLNSDGAGQAAAALGSLQASAGAADRFAAMNAVTQVDYQPILDLVAAAKARGQSAYLKSYMQTDETSAYAPMSKKKGMQKTGGLFDTLDDVFPAG